jgi:hypothetical protein
MVSGEIESCRRSSRCAWWGAGGQSQVGKDLDDDGGIFDGGDNLERPAAVGTMLKVQPENSPQQSSPSQSSRSFGLGRSPVGRHGCCPWHDLPPQFGIGCEHSMEAGQMQPRPGDQGRQALQEFQGGSFRWLVPSRQGVLSCRITSPSGLRERRSLAIVGRVM